MKHLSGAPPSIASLKDVAKRAGVSAMTVSRTLSGNYPVSAQTRRNVLDAVAELDYEPNILGRNLRAMRNRTVLVAGHGLVEAILTGVYRAANELNYEVILMNTRFSASGDYVRRIRNGMTRGILFMNMLDEETLARIGAEYPMVQCGSAVELPDSCVVTVDETEAVCDLVGRLLREGRKRIAFVTMEIGGEATGMSRRREAGFLRAHAAHGAVPMAGYRIRNDYLGEDLSPALALARRIVAMDPAERPDALVVEQNIQAVACVNHFREAGLAVPQEISVASMDDQPVNTVIQPTLTAVGHPYGAMGVEAMRMLAARIENAHIPSRKVVFQHELRVRGSTGPL
jgi:DNA-binding LacI/PurR family transcriptional regulator